MSFFSTAEKAFGLDISDKAIRLIQLKKSGNKIKIQSYNEILLPADCIVSGNIKQPQVFADSLKKLAKTRMGRGSLHKEVVVSLPESETFLKTFYIQTDNKALLCDKIKEELPLHIPMDLEEIYFDWQVAQEENGIFTIVAGASPKKIVDSYMSAISDAGFLPAVFEIEAAAISHLLIEHNKEEKTQIIIDIGANRTGLFLYDRGIIKFTVSLPISGNQIDQIIAESLDLEKTKAEEAKIAFGLDKDKVNGALLEVLTPTIEELQQQIMGAVDFYHNNFNDTQPIEKIVLCGGGANFKGIAPALGGRLNMEVVKSDPFKILENPDEAFFNQTRSQSFITAIGLAIRGLNSASFYDHS